MEVALLGVIVFCCSWLALLQPTFALFCVYAGAAVLYMGLLANAIH